MGRCNKQYEDVNSGQEEFEARKNLSKTRGPSTSFKRCERRMDVKTMCVVTKTLVTQDVIWTSFKRETLILKNTANDLFRNFIIKKNKLKIIDKFKIIYKNL